MTEDVQYHDSIKYLSSGERQMADDFGTAIGKEVAETVRKEMAEQKQGSAEGKAAGDKVEEQKGEEIGVVDMPGQEVPPPAPPHMVEEDQGRQDKSQGEHWEATDASLAAAEVANRSRAKLEEHREKLRSERSERKAEQGLEEAAYEAARIESPLAGMPPPP